MFPIYVPNCFALLIRCVQYICICIYLAMFISYCVCLKSGGRVVTNVVRTCDPTPLLYIYGNKICLNWMSMTRSLCIFKKYIRRHKTKIPQPQYLWLDFDKQNASKCLFLMHCI